MKNSSGRFKVNKMVQKVVRQFGAAGTEIRIPMRQCNDVPIFIENMEKAHKQTANSTLRFGPQKT